MKGVVEKVALHETYPGHHLQTAISRESVATHPIIKYIGNSGFYEGWATYGEVLADEMGLYSNPKNKLAMYINSNAIGMVLDAGIHYKNWTRAEAIEFLLEKRASYTKADAERLVNRVSVLPGQATSYGVGEMCFLQFREKAEVELGNKFDLKIFHDECLKNGNVPLNFLSERIKEWIENQ